MVTALGIFGARVTGARCAGEALAAIDADAPDVVLTDLVMPTVDGFTLLAQIRSREGALGRRIPAAALSARATTDAGATALSAGFEMYVPKPVDPFELAAVVRRLVGGAKRGA
jgi:CheY-like chemotaxis protein